MLKNPLKKYNSSKNTISNNTTNSNSTHNNTNRNDNNIYYTTDNTPIYKNYKMLKSFQLDALNWLINCHRNNHNCILGDEMGLGKTI